MEQKHSPLWGSIIQKGEYECFWQKDVSPWKKKGALDKDIPDFPEVPLDLKKAFTKNKKAKKGFENYTVSVQRNYLRWLFTAKREETRQKRIGQIVEAATQGKKLW